MLPHWPRPLNLELTSRGQPTVGAGSADDPTQLPADALGNAPFAAGDAQRLLGHKRYFRCHIPNCSRCSHGPARYPRGLYLPDGISLTALNDEVLDWRTPTGLDHCIACHQWTCIDHLDQRLCVQCRQSAIVVVCGRALCHRV
jgi:hypothetical protein